MSLFAERASVEQVELGQELAPRFNSEGLIPAIVADAQSNHILMLGYMNAEALERTISTREARFWSRSRAALWRKGEHSGFAQQVERIVVDDDQDACCRSIGDSHQSVRCYRLIKHGPICDRGVPICAFGIFLTLPSNAH